MGYYTEFSLSIKDENEKSIPDDYQEAIITQLREAYSDAADALDENGDSLCATTWENRNDEMKEFSKKYPDLVFDLWGSGDGQEDLWNTYYKDGKMQHCPVEFIFPGYDHSKLEA